MPPCQAEQALWDAYLENPTIENRNRLVELHWSLVIKLAQITFHKMACNPVVDQSDLIGYGSVGLMQAVQRFDPSRGWQFNTYASQRIRGAMLDGMRATDWVSRTAREAHRAGGDVPKELIPLPDGFNPEHNQSPNGPMESREFWQEIADALDDPTDRFFVLSHFRDGATVRTIARESKRSCHFVKERLGAAVSMLREIPELAT